MTRCSSTSGHRPLSSWLASAPVSEVRWAWVCCWAHCCGPWFCVSLPPSVPHCLRSWNFIAGLGIGWTESSHSIPLQHRSSYLSSFAFLYNFRVIISVSTKTWWSHVRPLDLRVGGMQVYHMLPWPPENPSTHFIFLLAGPGSCFTFASLMAHTGISCCFAVSKLNISPNFAASLLSELPFSYPLLVF